MTNGSLMKVESIADGVSCNSFDLYEAIIGLETHFFRMAVLHRFYYASIIGVQCGARRGARHGAWIL